MSRDYKRNSDWHSNNGSGSNNRSSHHRHRHHPNNKNNNTRSSSGSSSSGSSRSKNEGNWARARGRGGRSYQRNPKSPKLHAALVLLAVESTAQTCCDIFKDKQLAHDENQGLVKLNLPLPTNPGELLKTCTALIPAKALCDSLTRSLEEGYVCGAGVNPVLFRWLLDNVAALNAFASSSSRKWALLSTTELSSLKHGYPNCDFLGAVSHGTVDYKERPFLTAVREAKEESCLILPETVQSWDTPIDVKPEVEIEDRRLTERGYKHVIVNVFCRVLPAGFQANFVDRQVSLHGPPGAIGFSVPSSEKQPPAQNAAVVRRESKQPNEAEATGTKLANSGTSGERDTAHSETSGELDITQLAVELGKTSLEDEPVSST